MKHTEYSMYTVCLMQITAVSVRTPSNDNFYIQSGKRKQFTMRHTELRQGLRYDNFLSVSPEMIRPSCKSPYHSWLQEMLPIWNVWHFEN